MSDKQYVNIPTDVQDAHYRYKMERMNLKVEGRGNGIKTVVTNMSNVAAHLKVPVSYPTKYFGLELGAQSKFDKSNDRAIINGQFDYPQFETLLNNFIKKFVCCYRCHLPECSMTIDKHENIKLTCSACGHISTVPPAEKMATFIIKHPPKNKNTHVKANAQQGPVKADVTDLVRRADEDDEEWDPDVSDEAVRQRREEEGLQGRLAELAMDSDEEGGDKKKKKKTANDDDEDEEDDIVPPVEVLKNFLSLKKDATTKQILAAVNKIKEDYELSDKDAVCLMYESFFDKNIEKQIQKYAPALKPFVENSTSAQKIILGYTEELCGVKESSKLLSKVSVILKAFYDQGLLDEEVIVEWHSKKKSRFVKSSSVVLKVKEAAKPFVEWLNSAEEEEESDDEDN
ncbi:translation initiation factor 5 [Acrasis kona]|uniref:Translation initiation factor 5 n=1 Tax=Acrasis kona TaxID=1008807 RepID=A0AAW2Z663_9EUKA